MLAVDGGLMDTDGVREACTKVLKEEKTVTMDYDGVTETSRMKTAAQTAMEEATETLHEG